MAIKMEREGELAVCFCVADWSWAVTECVHVKHFPRFTKLITYRGVSGSEYDSDENMDLDEKDDVLEQEAGDDDDVGPEEDLRNQVHRVHL